MERETVVGVAVLHSLNRRKRRRVDQGKMRVK
jgi:hypothetical protein